MIKFALAAFAITAVLISGAAFAKSSDIPMIVSSPHVTTSHDDQIVSDHALVAGLTENEQTELPDTMVSEFSAVKDQVVKSAPAAKASVPMEVGASLGKRAV